MADKTRVDFNKFKNETGLDDPTTKELYVGFLEELQSEKEKLIKELQNKEYDRLSKTVHNIKGISSSYMAADVFTHARELDILLKSGKTDGAAILVDRLVSDIAEAVGEIADYCRE